MNRDHEHVWRTFKTYSELKKNLVQALTDTIEDHVLVSRSLRGEWGERYEHWQLNNKRKPFKIKEGWM
jgi:hypothetical protein